MEKETSKNEILEAINEFSTNVDKQFIYIKAEIGGIKAEMVTKDYLDRKLNESRGDIIDVIKQEDDKFKRLVLKLRERELLTLEDEKSILAKGPFPKLYVR
ncbi:MAG: hypothetical protein PHF50_03165 [Patescibacteria group bacterium]|nr:hypothetical protein [Patescibacteria group bacterium]